MSKSKAKIAMYECKRCGFGIAANREDPVVALRSGYYHYRCMMPSESVVVSSTKEEMGETLTGWVSQMQKFGEVDPSSIRLDDEEGLPCPCPSEPRSGEPTSNQTDEEDDEAEDA